MTTKINIALIFFAVAGIFFSSSGWAQSDITTWKKASVSGGIATNATYYNSWGMKNRRAPYFWMIQANLNVTIGPLSLPFSASISTQRKDFRYPQPFNHFGLSPTYKAVTLHLGYRSMQFSEFTLSGAEFLGVGLEVKPENSKFYTAAMYGRLQKPGTSRSYTGLPQYERWGEAIQVGYKWEQGDYSITFFKARDKVESLSDSVAGANEVSPAENLVVGVKAGQKLFKKWAVDMEYALSAYTTDIRMPEKVIDDYTYVNNFGSLFTPRASSYVADALSTSLTYQGEVFGANVKFRNVSPDYATMGSPYLTNDFRDITMGFNVNVLQGKINFGANGGVQTNNLESDKAADTRRLIGSINATWNATNKISMNASYANFNVSTQMTAFVQSTDGFVPDTLVFRQVNSNANLGMNYNFGTVNSQNISLIGTYQKASDNQGGGNQFYNANLAYQWNDAVHGLTASLGVNANNNVMVDANNQSVGPALTLSKSLKEIKLRNSFNCSHQQTFNNGDKSAEASCMRLNSSWSFAKKQSATFAASYMARNTFAEEEKKASEVRLTLNYNYRF